MLVDYSHEVNFQKKYYYRSILPNVVYHTICMKNDGFQDSRSVKVEIVVNGYSSLSKNVLYT